MKNLCLVACEHNWCLLGPGDLEKRSWKVFRDGRVSYRASYRPVGDVPVQDQCVEGIVEPADLKRLLEAVVEPWPADKVDACDGTAWEFYACNMDGKAIKQRKLGYIYGLEVFERITSFLWGLIEETAKDHPGEKNGDDVKAWR